jgi:hypothetical protein
LVSRDIKIEGCAYSVQNICLDPIDQNEDLDTASSEITMHAAQDVPWHLKQQISSHKSPGPQAQGQVDTAGGVRAGMYINVHVHEMR